MIPSGRTSAYSLAILALVAASSPAWADDTKCPDMYLGGVPPEPTSPKLRERATELCYTRFATTNSGLTRTSLWSAEHLTRDQVRAARELERVNSFHADANLQFDDRAENSDYKGSGYDRGHMSPNGDMPEPVSQAESFSLANMCPQDPDNNRNLWASIESSVRNLAISEGELFVVTGPIFYGATLKSVGGRVLVPTHIFKAVYSIPRNVAGVYLVDNAPGAEWKAISVNQLKAMANVDVFPALPDDAKDAVMELPPPAASRHRPVSQAGRGGETGFHAVEGAVMGEVRHEVRRRIREEVGSRFMRYFGAK